MLFFFVSLALQNGLSSFAIGWFNGFCDDGKMLQARTVMNGRLLGLRTSIIPQSYSRKAKFSFGSLSAEVLKFSVTRSRYFFYSLCSWGRMPHS
jgi:hypothetical protein